MNPSPHKPQIPRSTQGRTTRETGGHQTTEFSNKFGFLAYEAKIQRKTERKRIRMERQRRKERLQARGKPKRRAPARSDFESDADESGDTSSSDTDDSDVATPLRLYKPSTIR
ncbi:hypothetical protein DFH06DRAFT_1122491 [Mycena polygramma]|nr:hypothetical protein DFH06DRAFT_1122491 [Mycena polygramma]